MLNVLRVFGLPKRFLALLSFWPLRQVSSRLYQQAQERAANLSSSQHPPGLNHVHKDNEYPELTMSYLLSLQKMCCGFSLYPYLGSRPKG
jgi:hypothetical protein